MSEVNPLLPRGWRLVSVDTGPCGLEMRLAGPRADIGSVCTLDELRGAWLCACARAWQVHREDLRERGQAPEAR